MNTSTNEIESTKTSFALLEHLKRRDSAGVTELAQELDLPKSTVFSHLNTLHNEEYVVRDDGRYRLGHKFLEYGEQVRRNSMLQATARPQLESLAAETDELVNLMIEEFGDGVYVDLVEGEKAVQVDTYEGKRVPLYCTALGKSILAQHPDERVEAILDDCSLEPITSNTITDRDELFEELDRVRDRGVAFDDEERAEELRCVAAPIVSQGEVHGAVSVAGPLPRMNGDRYRSEIPELLINAASVIGINITYR